MSNRPVDGRIDGRMNEKMDGQRDISMDEYFSSSKASLRNEVRNVQVSE